MGYQGIASLPLGDIASDDIAPVNTVAGDDIAPVNGDDIAPVLTRARQRARRSTPSTHPKKPPAIARGRDSRFAVTKTFDRIVTAITNDLGAVRLTEMQKTLIRAFAGTAIKLDGYNAALMTGEDVDINEYTAAAEVMVRLSQRLSVQTWEELQRMGASNE
jgi:hypothetical protein